MEQIAHLIDLVIEHKEIVVTLVLAVIAVLKLTAWGKANAKALEAVVKVIEGLGLVEAKASVAAVEPKLSSGVQDALQNAVAKADLKKAPEGFGTKVAREVFRGLIPRK